MKSFSEEVMDWMKNTPELSELYTQEELKQLEQQFLELRKMEQELAELEELKRAIQAQPPFRRRSAQHKN